VISLVMLTGAVELQKLPLRLNDVRIGFDDVGMLRFSLPLSVGSYPNLATVVEAEGHSFVPNHLHLWVLAGGSTNGSVLLPSKAYSAARLYTVQLSRESLWSAW
jgi:hypothetical protein